MALALITLEEDASSPEQGRPSVVVDTGSNPWFRLVVGEEVAERDGISLVSALWISDVLRNPAAGRRLDTRFRTTLGDDLPPLRRPVLQLISYRSQDGTGPAWSAPVRLPVPVHAGRRRPAMNTRQLAAGSLSVTDGRALAGACSLDQVISAVLQVAGPLVQQALARAGGQAGATGPASGAAPDPLGDALAALLRTVVTAAGRQTPAAGLAATSSLNRMTGGTAQPFVFGVDDALLASLAGPLLQALPQLLNAVGQQRLDRQRQTDRAALDMLAEVDRTALLEQVLRAREAAPAPSPDLAALEQLLRAGGAPAPAPAASGAPAATAPAAPAAAPTAAPAAPAAPRAVGASLSTHTAPAHPALPSASVLSLRTAPHVLWRGRPRPVFGRDRAVRLRFVLEPAKAAPAQPLPRALLLVTLCSPEGGGVHLEKTVRLTELQPAAEFGADLEPGDLASLPADAELLLTAQLRWPSRSGTRQATVTSPLVVTGEASVAGLGDRTGDLQDLPDMGAHRGLWNRLWESPTTGEWELAATVRYEIGLHQASEHAARPTRSLSTDSAASGGLTGRLRGGIDLSASRLAELVRLWPGTPELTAAQKAALAAPGWWEPSRASATHPVRLSGNGGRRGVLWAVPVLGLRTVRLTRAAAYDEHGQVTATAEDQVLVPLPEAVRFVGLRTARDPESPDQVSGFGFAGYDVEFADAVAFEAGTAPASDRAAV